MAARRPAKIARVSPAIKLPPATAALQPAKVSPPNKLPDERLPAHQYIQGVATCVLRMTCRLTFLWRSLRAHLAVVTTRP